MDHPPPVRLHRYRGPQRAPDNWFSWSSVSLSEGREEGPFIWGYFCGGSQLHSRSKMTRGRFFWSLKGNVYSIRYWNGILLSVMVHSYIHRYEDLFLIYSLFISFISDFFKLCFPSIFLRGFCLRWVIFFWYPLEQGQGIDGSRDKWWANMTSKKKVWMNEFYLSSVTK